MTANSGKSTARREEPRREQRAVPFRFAHGETGVALRADAAHRGHSVIEVGIEILLDALAGILGGLKLGPAARAEVDVQIDQAWREKFARAIDLIRPGR